MILRLSALVFILCIVSLFIGTNEIVWSELFNLSKLDPSNNAWLTLTASRIPRLSALILVGIGLATSGVILQHIVRNKFVEPATSGGLDAAKLGILVAIIGLPNAGTFSKMLFSMAFCFIASLLSIAIIKRIRFKNSVLIPVLGLMYGSVLSAIAEFYAYKHNILQSMQGWLLGDFSRVVQGHYELVYLIVPIVALTYLFAHRFTLVGMGEEMATSLGLSYTVTTALGLFLVSVTVAASVITVGAIPFVGLVVPNLVALKYGENLSRTLPIVALGGACLLLVSDIIGRIIIYPFEVPIGLTAGGIGGVIFLILIVRGVRVNVTKFKIQLLQLVHDLSHLKPIRALAKYKLELSLTLVLGLMLIFILIGSDLNYGLDFDYLIPKRLLRLTTLIVGSVCLAVSAITFQTLVGNRILVPSIMGYEAVYLLWQALLLLVMSTKGLVLFNTGLLGTSGHFVISLLLMLAYSWLLHSWLLPKCNNDMFMLLLFGFVLTMVLSTITQFIQLRISPSEFAVMQGVSYTSFNRSTTDTLTYSVVVVVMVLWVGRKTLPILDVMALGRDQSLSLGVNHPKYVRLFLALIAILVAVSTSLIGPTGFMGIFIANIAYALASRNKHNHKVILPIACLVCIAIFLIAQLLVEHVFNYKTTVSILVNLVCGIYFLALVIHSSSNIQSKGMK